MKTIKLIGLFSLLLFFLSCITNRREESALRVHDNYKEHYVRDSIFVCDSIFVAQKSDTVFLERIRTLYRDRLCIDTFIVQDTIYMEKVVTKEKRVGNPLYFWYIIPLLFFTILVCRRLWHST